MLRKLFRVAARVMHGILIGIRAKPKVLLTVALGIFWLNLLLPPIFLSVARKPWSYFSFNPWLKRLPEWLASSEVPLQRKLEFLPNLALFWFVADGPGGVAPEWGFTVDVTDLVRIAFTSLLFGTYFALWFYGREQRKQCSAGTPATGRGGVAGALTSVLGLSTGPCHVVGCGAPVLPVMGLAFVGVSSGMLRFLMKVSKVGTAVLLLAVALAVVYQGWLASGASTDGRLSHAAPTPS